MKLLLQALVQLLLYIRRKADINLSLSSAIDRNLEKHCNVIQDIPEIFKKERMRVISRLGCTSMW